MRDTKQREPSAIDLWVERNAILVMLIGVALLVVAFVLEFNARFNGVDDGMFAPRHFVTGVGALFLFGGIKARRSAKRS